MDERELLQVCAAEESNAVGYWDNTLSKDQDKALKYYFGEPFGDEREGFSQVVSQDVAEVIDWRLPSLLRIFASGDMIAEYEPTGIEDEAYAKQATEYANHIFKKDNGGFLVLHDWFKDALLSKVGVVKVWWDESVVKHPKETQTGLSVVAVDNLLNDEDVTVIGKDTEETADVVAFPDGLIYTIEIQRKETKGRVCIETVPPEEFLISKRARSLSSAAYTAHRTKKTVSDLIAMGFDRKKVEGLAPAEHDVPEDRERERYKDEDGVGREGVSIDKMMREVWLLEEYVRTDFDGDGYAELVQVFRVNTTILEHKAVDCHPWATICPYPMPHKFYGQSDAEKVMDLQRIKSALWRQTLDNLYLTNNPSTELPEQAERTDGSTLEALQNPVIGGIIPTRQPGMLNPIIVPFAAGHSYQMLEYSNTVREQRTGVSRFNQGLEADTLNKTATGIGKIMDASKDRTELIARIFAETGVAELFRKILKLTVKYQDRPRTIRLRNEWVEMDPRHWNADMDVTVNVGLGTGNKDQNLIHLENIFQKQVVLHESGKVPIEYPHVYETVAKMVENMGIPNPERFFPDPTRVPEQEPQPDPAMVQAQMELQLEQQKAQADIQIQREKHTAQIELEREKATAQARLAEQKAQFEARLAEQKMVFEQQLAREQMAFQQQMQVQNAAVNAEVKLQKNRPGGDLDK